MEEGTESVIKIESDEENENESDGSQVEDWCFVCHDGGTIRECDFPKCGKAYHYKCIGKKKSFLTSNVSWNCARHSCSKCGEKPRIMCYCCPKAICNQCIDSAEFFPIKQENGFCKDCMNFVLLVEGIIDSDSSLHKRMSLGNLSIREIHLKEYYKIIKKKDGLTLNDIQSARRQWKNQEKRKSCESLDDAKKNKRSRVLRRTKLFFNTSSQNEEAVSSKTATLFAAIVLDNIRLVYLRRRLVEKLLEQPESFENKVKGTFVLVELPSRDGRQRETRQLVQVTGTRRTSSEQNEVDIKLLASNIPKDISVQMLSNADIFEKDCEDLRQQVQSGLLRRPTAEELEQKARLLHEDIVDDMIAMKLRMLQAKIDRANEKGWRREWFELLNKRTLLEAPSKRLQIINNVPAVISEVVDVNVMSNGNADDRQGTEGLSVSIPVEGAQGTCSCDKFSESSTSSVPINSAGAVALDPSPRLKDIMEDKMQNEGPAMEILDKKCKGSESASVSAVALDPSPRLKDTMEDKMQNEGPAMVILDKECKGSETASAVCLFKRSLGASTPIEGHARRLVNDLLVNDAMPSCPQTKETETNKDPEQLFPEINQNRPTQGQMEVVKSATMNTVEPRLEQTPEEQHSICSGLAFPLDGKVMTSVVDHHPIMTKHSNNESYLRRELDFVTDSLLNSSKHIALVEDELKRLKAKTEHDALVTATKISSIEEKLDLMFERHASESGGAQVEPAKEKITFSNESKMSVDDVGRLLEPIKRAGWTEALEEVKAKHLPHLDLREFPMYDPGARVKVDLIAKRVGELGIQIDHLFH